MQIHKYYVHIRTQEFTYEFIVFGKIRRKAGEALTKAWQTTGLREANQTSPALAMSLCGLVPAVSIRGIVSINYEENLYVISRVDIRFHMVTLLWSYKCPMRGPCPAGLQGTLTVAHVAAQFLIPNVRSAHPM